jgi:hypothetical protein
MIALGATLEKGIISFRPTPISGGGTPKVRQFREYARIKKNLTSR